MTESCNELQKLVKNKLKAYQAKDQIKALYLEGKSDTEISSELDIPENLIVSQRETQGLPNRYTQGLYYTDEDDSVIITLRDEKSFRWTEIAKKIDKGHSSQNIQLRYRYLDGLRTRRNKNGEPTVRKCMASECREPFLSEGYHMRFCDKCRNSDERHVDYHLVTHTSTNWD